MHSIFKPRGAVVLLLACSHSDPGIRVGQTASVIVPSGARRYYVPSPRIGGVTVAPRSSYSHDQTQPSVRWARTTPVVNTCPQPKSLLYCLVFFYCRSGDSVLPMRIFRAYFHIFAVQNQGILFFFITYMCSCWTTNDAEKMHRTTSPPRAVARCFSVLGSLYSGTAEACADKQKRCAAGGQEGETGREREQGEYRRQWHRRQRKGEEADENVEREAV